MPAFNYIDDPQKLYRLCQTLARSMDTEEPLTLEDEVFSAKGDVSVLMPTLSIVMSRYYPMYKLGHVLASFEVKPGYGSYLVDCHITKDLPISKDEEIRLLIASKDNVETSSCIISPQQVNILLNGRPVEKRTNVFMDPGPQAPTVVDHLLKYKTNVLQALGQFNGNYIFVIAAMAIIPTSDLPTPKDYVQLDAVLSGLDSEIIEGTSRISLNCPISYKRIKIPAKGHLCKHYQCFDLSNYVEINSKRPSWRCSHCNQSVGFTDLRVDQMMVKVLQEAGENVSEVTIYADGSWKVASSIGKDDSCDKAPNKQGDQSVNEANGSSGKSDGQRNVFDLTTDDCDMDTSDARAYVDEKPVLHHDLQGESVFRNFASPSNPRSSNESFQFSVSQAANSPSTSIQFPVSQAANSPSSSSSSQFPFSLTATRPSSSSSSQLPFSLAATRPSSSSFQFPVSQAASNIGIASVQTDAVSPSLNRQPNNYQGANYPVNPVGLSQLSPPDSLQLAEMSYGCVIPRSASPVPSAIQAFPVQTPTQSSLQHVRPVPFQIPRSSIQQAATAIGVGVERQQHHELRQSIRSHMLRASSQQAATPAGISVEHQHQQQWQRQRQHQHLQSHINGLVSGIPTASMQNSATSQGVGMSTPSYNNMLMHHQPLSQPPHLMRSRQTLSQPPHLMRSSQLPRSHPQEVVLDGVATNIQRVQLTSSQPSQARQQPTLHSQPHLARPSSSTPWNPGNTPQPSQARQHPTLYSQPHLTRTSSSTPSNPAITPQPTQARQHPTVYSQPHLARTSSSAPLTPAITPQPAQARQHPTIPSQSHSARTSSSTPSNPAITPQPTQARQHPTLPSQPHSARTSSSSTPLAVSRTENLIDISEQTWRPTGRMRGALTGQAYSAAFNQYINPGSTPSPRPPAVSASSTSTPENHLQAIFDTNRMIARATQMPNRSTTDETTKG